MNLGIQNKTVLVTASSKGIGKAAAELFASEKCNVAICSRSAVELEKTAAELSAKYDNEIFWIVCDLNNPSDIKNTVEKVEEKFGGIDILVNNCGGPSAGFFDELNEEKWNFGYEQVLLSVVRFTRAVLPNMKKKNWGRIINITSVAVKQQIDNLLLSNTFRSGVIGLSKSLSNQLAKHNITVNSVAPGYTLTERIYELAVNKAKVTGESHETILVGMTKEIPLGRMARPEEIASAILFLASEQASYITGNTIQIDGGLYKGLM